MKRIAIIGISGSGKSTFANKLGKKLGREVIHLDKEYWTSDWKKRYPTRDEWKAFVRELAAKDEWIMDGNYQSTLEIRFVRADTIIFFDFPKWRALWRAFIRIFDQKQLFHLPSGAKQKISYGLISRILNFPQYEIRTMVDKYRNQSKVFVVKNNKDINNLLKELN
jgi:adenylate kinase family enzyme